MNRSKYIAEGFLKKTTLFDDKLYYVFIPKSFFIYTGFREPQALLEITSPSNPSLLKDRDKHDPLIGFTGIFFVTEKESEQKSEKILMPLKFIMFSSKPENQLSDVIDALQKLAPTLKSNDIQKMDFFKTCLLNSENFFIFESALKYIFSTPDIDASVFEPGLINNFPQAYIELFFNLLRDSYGERANSYLKKLTTPEYKIHIRMLSVRTIGMLKIDSDETLLYDLLTSESEEPRLRAEAARSLASVNAVKLFSFLKNFLDTNSASDPAYPEFDKIFKDLSEEKNALKTVDEYLDALKLGNGNLAYMKLHPQLRERSSPYKIVQYGYIVTRYVIADMDPAGDQFLVTAYIFSVKMASGALYFETTLFYLKKSDNKWYISNIVPGKAFNVD
jgi:hypothetical protein